MLWKSLLIFAAALTLYFGSRSPGLDEIDSINFAMGIHEFNLWKHQPHPPGYPLFIALGWLGVKGAGLTEETSLHLLSAIGGAIFVAAWFLIIRFQFNERLAWWLAICLGITPVVWMSATKALTDTLAAGLLSTQILAALYFIQNRRTGTLLTEAIAGAAAAGARPQLILVVFVILVLSLRKARTAAKLWVLAWGALIAACLLWLLPMWYIQSHLRPDVPAESVYPSLVYGFWAGRLHDPTMYLFAQQWSIKYLALRFAFHILGWFGLGLGFVQSWFVLVAGTLIAVAGLLAYFWRPLQPQDRAFWRFHVPWAIVHIAIIFISLPATQRYYLIIYPLLLIVLLRGFLDLPSPWRGLAITLPAILLFTTIPLAVLNHKIEGPPILLIKYLDKLCPPPTRSRVALVFSTRTKRHAEWYAPAFRTISPIPLPDQLEEVTKNADTIFTDDPTAPLPKGWYRVPLVVFARSAVIYWKAHFVELYWVVRSPPK